MMTTAATTFDSRIDPVVRGLVTIGALILLFVGLHIPLPGLSPEMLQQVLSHQLSPARVSIFALGVTPILFARVILELCRLVIPSLARWAANPEHDGQWTKFGQGLALALAGVQAYGVALAFERVANAGDEMGWDFSVGIIATAVGATALLIALADFVTRRGLGDGLLILLAAPMIARAPHDLMFFFELGRMGAISAAMLPETIVLVVIAVALLAVASLVRDPARGVLAGANLDVWPPLLASSVLGPLGAAAILLLGASNLPPASLVLIIHVLALAGLIALFATLRERAGASQPNRGPVTVVEIAVCVGAVIFAYIFGMTGATAGLAIIVIVAAILSCFSRSVRL
jgi:preprotein translocase subunit SecY